jgi:hypothetical protein
MAEAEPEGTSKRGVVVGIIVVVVGTLATLALLMNAVRLADTSTDRRRGARDGRGRPTA